MALTFVSWRLIQTERFGSLLSSRIAAIAKEKMSIDLDFQRVELELFPISTKLINVKINQNNYALEAGDVSLIFGIRDLFAKKFSIGKIVINESLISIPKIDTSTNNEKFDLNTYFEKYQKFLFEEASFHLRGVEVYNTKIDYDNNKSTVYALNLSFYKNIITANVNASTDKLVLESLFDKVSSLPDIDGVKAALQITRDNIRVKELSILSETSSVSLSTKILADGKISDGEVRGFIELNKLKTAIPNGVVNEKLLPEGGLEFKLKFKDVSGVPVFNGSFYGKGLNAGLYNLDEVSGEIDSNGKTLSLKKLNGKMNNGDLYIDERVAIYNWDEKKVINPRFDIRIKNIFSNNLLFFIDGLNGAKFSLNGILGVEFFDNKFILSAKNKVGLTDFKLLSKDGETIVANDLVEIQDKGMIDIRYDGQVDFSTFLKIKNSKIGLFGYVNGDEVNIDVGEAWIDFEELGPIVGAQVIGRGDVKGRIAGPLEAVVFDLDMNQNEFEIIDFKLGSINGKMKYHLDTQRMELRQIEGAYKSIEYTADGNLFFDRNVNDQLNIGINILKGTLEDARVALSPIVTPLKNYLDKVSFNFRSSVYLKGKMNVPNMRVKGNLHTSNLMVSNEDVDTISGDFNLDNNTIRWENIKAKKVSGALTGESIYNLGTKEFTYRFSLSSLRLKDILYYRLMSLGLDGEAFGEFYGVGEGGNFSSRSHIRVTNSSIENFKLNDSVLTVYNNNTDLFFSGTLIGGDASVEGYLNLNAKDQDKLSSVTAKVKSDEVKVLAGILSQHNIFNKDLKGHIESTVQVDFDINNIETLNMIGSLDRAELHYSGINFKLKKRPSIVEIENGEFKNWNYHFVGDGIDLKSIGTGKIGDEFRLIHKFSVNSAILELVNDKIENSYGTLKGEHVIFSSDRIKNFLTLEGDNISLKAKKLPGLITNLNLDVSMDNDRVVINSLKGSYGNGEVAGSGVVKLKFPFPEIDLKLNVEKTRYPLFKKSGIVLSGDLSFKGKKLPYDLTGDLAIISGEIIEETNELASSAISDESYQRYIPVGYLEGNISFMKNNIRIISFDPIRIKNGMMNLGLLGNMKIFGTLSNPKFNGVLSLSNNENKFLFKGHEFLLSEGIIHFVDGARKESPDLRFAGTAKINEYDVYINVSGPADSLVVEMSSNPPLIQGDILSLLTLGVTSDVSKNLGERQRQSVTTLSIGSLIMDQLKINQSLNDSLGLRLSVQPEFEEDGTSLLEGKVDDASSNNRLQSATVVRVQKRINKKVNLSVSSTVGGSVVQSQEMNINYKINKMWSLEGVYEVKSNDELEQQIPDSVGADVKYQWSF